MYALCDKGSRLLTLAGTELHAWFCSVPNGGPNSDMHIGHLLADFCLWSYCRFLLVASRVSPDDRCSRGGGLVQTTTSCIWSLTFHASSFRQPRTRTRSFPASLDQGGSHGTKGGVIVRENPS